MSFWTVVLAIFIATLLKEIVAEALRFGFGYWIANRQIAREKELAEEFKTKLTEQGINPMEAMFGGTLPMGLDVGGTSVNTLPTVSGEGADRDGHGQYL